MEFMQDIEGNRTFYFREDDPDLDLDFDFLDFLECDGLEEEPSLREEDPPPDP